MTLLAEKVETLEEFEICRDLGFDLFQGYFLAKPEIIVGRKLDSNQMALMKILAEINNPQADLGQLTRSVEQDAALCIKLLRYVNSSHLGIRRHVESLQHACVLLGLEGVRTVATLLMLAGNKHIPQQAARLALLRGWMCRRLAEHYNAGNPHPFFTAGLLSMLDVLMGQPLEDMLAELPLDQSIRSAILHGEELLGKVLKLVVLYEQCRWEELARRGADPTILRQAYLDSVTQIKKAWDA